MSVHRRGDYAQPVSCGPRTPCAFRPSYTTRRMAAKNETHEVFSRAEVELAFRNHGGFTEGLRRDITPVGMHYLLVHYDIPEIDAQQWRLKIGGHVSRPMELTLEQVKSRPKITRAVTLECAGNGRSLMKPRRQSVPWNNQAFGTAEWTGCSLRDLLEEAGVLNSAVEIVFTGSDRGHEGNIQHYQRSLSVAEATLDEMMLAYEMNGQSLPPQHGYPLRLIAPGWYGMASVKWLCQIEAVAKPFQGTQMELYSFYKSESDPNPVRVTTQLVKSILAPPGIPDFISRTRIVETGIHKLIGRAWAGKNTVTKVEISQDDGKTWKEAKLNPPGSRDLGRFGWKKVVFDWNVLEPGDYVLCIRATDSAGNVQPRNAEFNVRGFANNSIQRIPVTVVHKLKTGESLPIQDPTFKRLPITESKL